MKIQGHKDYELDRLRSENIELRAIITKLFAELKTYIKKNEDYITNLNVRRGRQ